MRRAAERAGLPLVLSFTVETDGALPGGKPLALAIAEVDDATGGCPRIEERSALGRSHWRIAGQCLGQYDLREEK